jgi:hypothetical protein
MQMNSFNSSYNINYIKNQVECKIEETTYPMLTFSVVESVVSSEKAGVLSSSASMIWWLTVFLLLQQQK